MPSRPHLRSFLAVAIAAALAAACGPKRVGEITYAEGAQEGYEKGLEELEDQNYEQAIAAFEQVRTKFPYSSYAALAELRIADADFGRGRYLEAIAGYQAFVKFHPTHEQLDWATFRIGESHYKAIPSGFFLFPSPSERDQTEVRAARTTLSDFLAQFPSSPHVPRAREALDQVMRLLVRHEMYAADFYVSRKRWAGAEGRYRYVLSHYPDGGHVPEAILGLAAALREQGKNDRAAEVLEDFLSTNPGGDDARKARGILESLPRTPPAPAEAAP